MASRRRNWTVVAVVVVSPWRRRIGRCHASSATVRRRRVRRRGAAVPPVVDAATTSSSVAPGGDRPPSVAVAAPTAATWGVPVGYPQSPAGVRAAAVTWVSSLGELMAMGPIARNDTLRRCCRSARSARRVEEFRAERDRFITQFQRDLSQAMWIDAPLTVEIVSAEATRAVVEVWSVLMFGTTSRTGRDAVADPHGDAGVGARVVAGRRRRPAVTARPRCSAPTDAVDGRRVR